VDPTSEGKRITRWGCSTCDDEFSVMDEGRRGCNFVVKGEGRNKTGNGEDGRGEGLKRWRLRLEQRSGMEEVGEWRL